MIHTLAFYNVENLYDISNDKKTLDDDFTFQGNRSWNLTRYQNKLIRISKAISSMGKEQTSNLPTFFGLCEIENKKVIEDLLQKFPPDANYGFVHLDSLDERGIDTAFFYNKNYFTLEHYDFLRIPVYNSDGLRDFTRDITYAKGILGKSELHFFVLHLPSKREEDINLPKRIHLLQELRKKLNSIFDEDKNAHIVIMGDFNENPSASYLYQQLWCKKTIEELSYGELFNPSEELYRKGSFSVFHSGRGLLFDQIIFSQSFFKKGNPVRFIKAGIFNAPFLQDPERGKLGTPWRTYSGSRYLGGFSDHFPVYAFIEQD